VHVDPAVVSWDEEAGVWNYQPPDWDEIKRVLVDGGPRYEDWRSKVADSLQRNAVYRDVALARSAA
jgi:hypothetical protein